MQNSSPFDRALKEFMSRLPQLVETATTYVGAAHDSSAAFNAAFSACQSLLCGHFQQEYAREDPFSVFPEHLREITPAIGRGQLDTLLVQHLLLERLYSCVFPDAIRHNFIARQVDAVLQALCEVGFDRGEFLASLDSFYLDLEREFRMGTSSAETQHMLSEVCEQFLNCFDPQQAQEWCVKYTPQEIVDFMCASVQQQLMQAFGCTLSSPNVPILDPCAGTGTFIVNAMGRIARDALPHKYRREIFCIEIMLLPYLLAKLNIEQAYYTRTGRYEPFQGMRYANALG